MRTHNQPPRRQRQNNTNPTTNRQVNYSPMASPQPSGLPPLRTAARQAAASAVTGPAQCVRLVRQLDAECRTCKCGARADEGAYQCPKCISRAVWRRRRLHARMLRARVARVHRDAASQSASTSGGR